MPRLSKKKEGIYKPYKREDFDKAIQAVENGNMSQRKASKTYGVPQATISDFINGKVDPGAIAGRKPVIPSKVEKQIVQKCETASQMGLGMSKQQVLEKVGHVTKELKLKTPFKNGIPGKDWWQGFKQRNPTVTLRIPEKLTSVRARGLNELKVGDYLIALKGCISDLKLEDKPECIWNMDEKGISMEHNPVKVVAGKGSRCTPGRVTNSRQNNTMIACISASGVAMKPLIIVKGKTEKALLGFNTSEGPRGAKWTYQQNAWTEDILGVDWFTEIFLKECGVGRPQLLIVDGHHSHEVLGLIEKASENNIHILALPPHTTHYLCPLDRCVFGPFSTYYDQVCSEFCQGNVINKVTWPALLARAYYRSFTIDNIESGFKACSIMPWNPLKIPAQAFAPSDAFNTGIKSSDEHPLQWVLDKLRSESRKLPASEPKEITNQSDAGVISGNPVSVTTADENDRISQTNVDDSGICFHASDAPGSPDDPRFMRDISASLLLPVEDTETRDAVESLLTLDNNANIIYNIEITSPEEGQLIDIPLAVSGQYPVETIQSEFNDLGLPPTMSEWNHSVESMFSVAPPPPKKTKSSKNTGHRLLTSKEVIDEKRKLEETKRKKDLEKQKRLKVKELVQAKKVIEAQLKDVRQEINSVKQC